MDAQSNPPAGGGRTWVADLLASLVVFMVALPLCVAIAKASGFPPEAGVITGVVGGLLVGILAGSPLQVSGPAAGLIVVVLDLVRDTGMNGFGLALMLAGLMQVAFGALRLGQWFRAVSPAVVMGMLAGIGLIILGKQFHVLFDTPAPDSILQAFRAAPETVLAAVRQPSLTGPAAAGVIGVLTILIMVAWKPIAPGWLKIIPAAVVAVVAVSALAAAAGWNVNKVQITGLVEELKTIPSPPWERLLDGHIWSAALTIALIASAETLLCATAVDTKHTGPRTQFNRELLAQGVGNVTCGALGALPMTGVIVRSSANLDAGAKTRLSSILHGLWLFLFVAFLDDVLAYVPLAALAGVLIYTGWKLLELPAVWKLWKERASRVEVAVYVITASAIVLTDLLTGVIIGLAVAAAKLLWTISHLTIRREDEPGKHRVHIHLDGAATFLRLPHLAEALEKVPRGQHLHVHMERVRMVDHAILQLLVTYQKQYEAGGGRMYLDWEHLKARFRSPATSAGHTVATPVRNGEPESKVLDGHPQQVPSP